MDNTKTKDNEIYSIIACVALWIFPLLIGKFCETWIKISIGLLVQTLIYMSLVMLLMVTTRKVRLSFIVINLIEYIFAVVSFLKLETRCEIFEPWDLVYVGNAGDIINFLSIDITYYICIFMELFYVIALTIFQILVFEKYCKIPNKIKSWIIVAISIISLLFFALFYQDIEMKYIAPNRNGFENHSGWRQLAECGALGSFIIDIGIMDVGEEPQNYSEETINKLYEEYKNYSISEEAIEYDNVIIVLLESYVDMSKIEELSFEKDPLDNYHKYMNEFATGSLLITNLGGGTANTEYKAFTMFSTDQYATGIMAYIHCINRDIDVLPRIFKENGYNVTGIHSYNKGFYNRYKAYPYIGIDKFVSDEEMQDAQMYGNYISDIEVYNKIVEIIEQEDKSFITATTMGTHMPWNNLSFLEYEEKIEDSRLSKSYNLMLNNYIQELRVSDEMLEMLIEYIKKSDEKTLLIAFGDHFPPMQEVFRDLEMIEENENNITPNKYPNLFKTPYIVVSNVEDIESKGDMVASRLGSYILEHVKLENLPWYYKVIHDYFENGDNKTKESLKEFYEMLQYDEIFGEKYWKKILKTY